MATELHLLPFIVSSSFQLTGGLSFYEIHLQFYIKEIKVELHFQVSGNKWRGEKKEKLVSFIDSFAGI